jgi:hypothetical protein
LRRWLVVGSPEDRRVTAFQAALGRRERTAAEIVPWLDVVGNPAGLRSRVSSRDVLRIESPGSDPDVWQSLAVLGGWIGSAPAVGEWRPGRAWFGGLKRTLEALDAGLAGRRPLLMHSCGEILAMTDKAICRERLAEAGAPIPPGFVAPPSVDLLREMVCARGWTQVFVKPRWGSSGAGVLAYRRSSRGVHAEERIHAALALRHGPAGVQWVNSKRLRTYRASPEIECLLAGVLGDGAVVERWIPKIGLRGGPLDLRVLVIAGRVRHRIARVGTGPITNLHLDAERLDVDTVLDALPAGTWSRVEDACLRAAGAFPHSTMVALDCLLSDSGSPLILEGNAWGDHLRGVMHEGQDAYEAEIAAFAPAHASACA